jgi:hypothetical protein
MALAIFVTCLSLTRLADIWAMRRRWHRFKRMVLNIALACAMVGLVWVSSIEVCDPTTLACRRVFF